MLKKRRWHKKTMIAFLISHGYFIVDCNGVVT